MIQKDQRLKAKQTIEKAKKSERGKTMFKKKLANKLANKCLAFGISFSIVFGGMSGMTVRGNGAADTETASASEDSTGEILADGADAVGIPEDVWDAADECPSGAPENDVTEYGEILEVSEKTEESEGIALSRKEQKAAEKAAKKAQKEAEKEAKEKEKEDKKNEKEQEKEDKKNEKEQEKEEKEQQKEERKLAKKLDKEKHDKTSIVSSVDDQEELWNIVSVGGAEGGIATVGGDGAVADPVKVAILDSGVDYTDDIDVYMRKNFVPGEDDISVIYEDISGHGTSVAGIIAAKDNDEGITGINPDVQLYSARILDENRQAPASRVVAAIDWAVAQDVDIINISFGTTVDSEEIHAAIRRAYDAGILIVAAAGNHGVVEYPAAYDEVIAVGAVDAKGERAEGSAVGDELELVAPGQQIVSTGAFGGVCVVGGTSLAAPHVAGVASVLWQKDTSVSADFIRSLLAFTANQYGEDYEYGNGLVDLDFALGQYDAFKEVYVADADVLNEQVGDAIEDGLLEVNEKPVVEFTDVVYVEGSWGPERHELFAEGTSPSGILSGNNLTVVKLGAVAQDRLLPGMKIHSEWHGYTRHAINDVPIYYSNYVFTYIYMTEIANGVMHRKTPMDVINSVTAVCIDTSSCPGKEYCVDAMVEQIQKKFYSKGICTENDQGVSTGEKTWSELLNGKPTTDENIALFIYGMALHILTDTFAHSSYMLEGTKWTKITHDLGADKPNIVPERLKCSSLASGFLISHIINQETGSVSDFYKVASNTEFTAKKSFRLGNLSEYIKAIDTTYYNSHRTIFDAMSYFDKIKK